MSSLSACQFGVPAGAGSISSRAHGREHAPDGRPCRTGRQRLVAVDAGCEDGLRETGSCAASRLAVPQPRAQEARGTAQRTAAPPQRHVPLERIDIP